MTKSEEKKVKDHQSTFGHVNSADESRSDDLSSSSSLIDDCDSLISFNSQSNESNFDKIGNKAKISFDASDNVVSIPNTPCSPVDHAVHSNQTSSSYSQSYEVRNPITPTIDSKLSPLKQPPPPPFASSLMLDDVEPLHIDSISMESNILDPKSSSRIIRSKEIKLAVEPKLVRDVYKSPTNEIPNDNLKCTTRAVLFSVPLDTLHTIATFLVVEDWRNFGMVSKEASNVCREIFHRIKIHAFKCAVEVAIAWNRGEHADAKELAALYISCGVPIYPAPMGHSYHTINWRMKIETDVMVSSTEEESGAANDVRNKIDSFYLRRNDHAVMTLTYLEEKGMFWKSKLTGIRTELSIDELHRLKRRFSPRSATPVVQFFDEMHPLAIGEHGIVLPEVRQFQAMNTVTARNSSLSTDSQLNLHREKVVVYCHRHLVDNHYRHKPSVNDEDGNMVSSTINLSTDFFHPVFPRSPMRDVKISTHSNIANSENKSATNVCSNTRPISRRSHRGVIVGAGDCNNSVHQARDRIGTTRLFEFFQHNVIADLDIRAYDSRAFEYHNYGESEGLSYTITSSEERSIVARYEIKLRTLLQGCNYRAFDECLLDFWDEFFSATATVHFYDQNTPIVRMSKLYDFLSKPYPKAWGTMECEIERIRVKYRVKGVIGRYYSTYEYRLFIRDRRKSQNDGVSDNETFPRIDTVLMTSKYRGKHCPHQLITTSDQPKRGANRYYVCLPEKDDIIDHFRKVNEYTRLEGLNLYHQEVPCSDHRMELCRVQTNHFGTDFQISVPCVDRGNRETESGRFDSTPQCRSEGSPITSFKSNMKKKTLFKELSGLFNLRKAAESSRNKRPISPKFSTRVSPSASSSQSDLEQGMVLPSSRERDIGAITYTANVLGNRPRVMNVCIPKLHNENTAPESPSDSWIRNSGDECKMLNLLKDFQHGSWSNQEGNEVESNLNQVQNLILLQNRPPWWNHELNAFVLNFGGRVSVASVKNFQLCERHDRQNIILQFGRIEGRHAFTCDFTYPLSPMQAFAISISSLQSRFSFA